MDTIQPNAWVQIDYVLRDEAGRELDSSTAEGNEAVSYIHGYGMMLPGLETALSGLKPGDTKNVVVPVEEAFGERDEELVLEIDRAETPRPDEVAPGDEIVAESPDGDEVTLRVVEVRADTVVVDANHPLAGLVLHYAVTVRAVRDATAAEIAAAAESFDQAGHEPPAETSGLVQLGRRRS